MKTGTHPTMIAHNTPIRRGARSRRVQAGGFALLELIIALSVSAFIAMYAARDLAVKSEEVLAEGAGTYIKTVSDAAQRHVLLNFNNLANGVAVPGTAIPLQPTLAELQAVGRLATSFPIAAGSLPTRQSVQVNITRANCPGASCTLTALVCTSTPVTLGAADVRYDLMQTMVNQQGGSGGQSLMGNGAVIRGASLNVANPLGNVEGIVCGSTNVDTALFDRFVQVNDTRDPNLQGTLTVNGAAALNGGATVTGSLTATGALSAASAAIGGCATIDGTTGRSGFGCVNRDNVPAGWTGGVRSPDLVASGNSLVSDNPGGFTGANTNYVLATANNGSGQAELRTSGRTVADRIVPTGQYAQGAACAVADEGSIARRSGGNGLVVCQSGAWGTLQLRANAGDACAPEGSSATSATGVKLLCVNGAFVGMDTLVRSATPGQACADPGTTAVDTAVANETLLCRANPGGGGARYMRMRDLTSNLSFVGATEVTDVTVGASGVVSKPTCAAAASQTAYPIIQIIPKIYSSPDGGQAFYAVDIGAAWQINLKNGAGTPLTGNPSATALAQVFCYYP